MPDAIQNIARVRTLLGNPLPTAPTDPQIYEALQGVLQLHANELANTQARWATNSVPLTFAAGNTERAIGNEFFGKPFWAYVIDDSNEFVRDVPLYDLANQRNDWSWGMFGQDSLAVYRVGGDWRARYLGSVTSSVVRIVLHYEDTEGEYQRPTDVRGLSPFQALFRVQACLSVLPFAEWEDCRRAAEEYPLKVSMVRDQRTKEEAQHWASFKRYKNTINRAGVTFKTPNYDLDFYRTGGRGGGRFAG